MKWQPKVFKDYEKGAEDDLLLGYIDVLVKEDDQLDSVLGQDNDIQHAHWRKSVRD